MPIIDAHSHYMPPEVAQNTQFFKVGWSDVDRQLAAMDAHGVDKAVLLYPTSDAHRTMGGWGPLCRTYNQAVADVVRRHPDRFIGGGIVPIDAPDQIRDELRRLQDLGLKVVSLASSYDGRYLDDPVFDEVYAFAREHALPIHVHSQIMNPIGEERVRDPLLSPALEYVMDVTMCLGKMMMEGTFVRHPEVKFIFAHYGGVLPLVKERFDTTYTMLRKRNIVKDLGKLPGEYFKNLYLDTSGSKSAASLLCALEVAPADHILFGSDFPANPNLAEAMEVIRSAPLTEGEQEKIFCNEMFL